MYHIYNEVLKVSLSITHDQIENKLRSIIKEVLPHSDVDIEKLTKEQNFDALAFDSLGLAELFITIENEFDVYISEEEAQKIHTLKALTDVIFQKKHSSMEKK